MSGVLKANLKMFFKVCSGSNIKSSYLMKYDGISLAVLRKVISKKSLHIPEVISTPTSYYSLQSTFKSVVTVRLWDLVSPIITHE